MKTDKYLLPWHELYDITGNPFYERRFLIDINKDIKCASQVWKYLENWRGSFFFFNSPTKEAAMEKEDEHLIKNGYTLLTAEQAEKLVVLL